MHFNEIHQNEPDSIMKIIKTIKTGILVAVAGSLLGVASVSANVLVTEPFDYNPGVWTQSGSNWTATMGSGSGTGWGANNWFSHIGAGLQFGIATGGHTGTFADSTGLNYLSNEYRQRNMSPAVHNNTDGSVIWQYLSMSRSGTEIIGQLTTQNTNGGMQYAVRIDADGNYALLTGQRNTNIQTSAIAASTDSSAPDVIVVRMENQTAEATNLFDVSMWVNPTATTEGGLPAPDLQILGTAPFNSNRNIGSINWRPGNTQIDNFKLASDYEDFGIGVVVAGPVIGVKHGVVSLTDGSSTVDLGASVTGIAVNTELTITNDGTATLTLGTISLDGVDAVDFSVGSPGATILAPAASTTFTVTFTPAVYGVVNATIHIANDSPGDLDPFDIAVTGTGLPPISVKQGINSLTDGSATPVNLGTTVVGTAVGKTFTITNGGTAVLTLGAMILDGADMADFAVGALGSNSLNSGESTTFTVTFTPSVATEETAAIRIVNSADGDVNPFDIALTGTGHLLGSTIVVTEPFDYNVGVFTQTGTNWVADMGSGSGMGWGDNEWFSHSTGLTFGIATGGHTGTFADSTGMNNLSNSWRERTMNPAVHNNTGGSVIWQYLTVSTTGTGTAGQWTTQNSNGGGQFAVRVMTDGTYALSAEHQNAKTETSAIAASQNASHPDIIVVKMENRIGVNLFDVSMWINPTATTEGGLPAPDLQILNAASFQGNRNIGSINWTPGMTQIDNFKLAGDYADFEITVPPSGSYSTWATANAGNQSANEDYDLDGVSNGVEYFMGETGSSFTANPSIDSNNKLTWAKDATFIGSYEVQSSSNLTDWAQVPGASITDNGTSVVCDVSLLTPVNGKVFIRLVVTPG